MSVDATHPLYDKKLLTWEKMRHTSEGEDKIKSLTVRYLPPTPGQILDGLGSTEDGGKSYASYVIRARFPGFVDDAIRTLIGVMHHKPPTIELPAAMESMIDSATIKGESLEHLLRQINTEQLSTGRVGVFTDVQDESPAGTPPHLALYFAESIKNWDDGRREQGLQKTNLVILDESEEERGADFEWEEKEKHRVLLLDEERTPAVYQFGVFTEATQDFDPTMMRDAKINNRTIDKIPFVVINANDVVLDPDEPPLLNLANLCLVMYRGQADYRQSLFMQGQDTLVIIGGPTEDPEDGATRAGAGAKIEVDVNGDAKYIGVSSEGLKEQREALSNDKNEAGELGMRLLDTSSREAESGQALHIRVSARTASLNQIAKAGAEGLQQLLRITAEWLGANPDEVIVRPNLDFSNRGMTGRDVKEMQEAKNIGGPISAETIHDQMRERDLTKKTYEEELEAIEKEPSILDGGVTNPDLLPDDSEGEAVA